MVFVVSPSSNSGVCVSHVVQNSHHISNAPFFASFYSISTLLGVLKSYVDGLYDFCVFAFIMSHAVHAACRMRA